MEGINLSPTAQEILAIYFANTGQRFYVNELIRKTGRYPNSVHQALKSLEKQKILLPSRRGRLKLHSLNKSYKFLSEIKAILEKQERLPKKEEAERPQWIRLLARQSSIPFSTNLAKGMRDLMPTVIDYNQLYYWNNNVTTGIYDAGDELIAIGKLIAERMNKDPKYARWLAEECRKRADKVIRETESFKKIKFSELTKKELLTHLKGYQRRTLRLMPFMTVPHSVERVLQQGIGGRLKELCEKAGKLPEYEKYVEIFTTPLEEEAEEMDSALRIAAHIKKFGWDKKAIKLLADHTEEFGWIPLDTMAKEPLTESYFKEEVESLMKRFKNPLGEITRRKRLRKGRVKDQKKALRELKADSLFKEQAELLQAFIFLRTYRRNANAKGHYHLLPLLRELAHRMRISEEEVKHLTYDEMLSWLKHGYGKKFGCSHKGLRKEIGKRMSGWAVLSWKGKIRIFSRVKNILEAMERYRIVAPGPAAVKVIKGNPACRGKATGRVKIVRKLSELSKAEKGDILVAKMTTPDYIVAIRKAAAIVTDEGGMTSHAATVSRELNIPCIVGTGNATQMLLDGDLVEVDADAGVIRMVEAVEIPEDTEEISGKTAYKGRAKGPVCIVLDAGDFPKVREGDILVAPQTTPEYLSSLYKVSGFVVDEESLTSHAMLYAKTLRIPAIIGTQFARNVLHDGDLVEVDAEKGVVRKLEK